MFTFTSDINRPNFGQFIKGRRIVDVFGNWAFEKPEASAKMVWEIPFSRVVISCALITCLLQGELATIVSWSNEIRTKHVLTLSRHLKALSKVTPFDSSCLFLTPLDNWSQTVCSHAFRSK